MNDMLSDMFKSQVWMSLRVADLNQDFTGRIIASAIDKGNLIKIESRKATITLIKSTVFILDLTFTKRGRYHTLVFARAAFLLS